MIRLKCQECGYIHNGISENDTFKECPICEGKMEVDNLKDIIIDSGLKKMKRQIKEKGKYEIWAMIERNFPNPITRLKFRQLYYEALRELKERGDIK